MMQKDKKLVIAFLVILFGICLCIPCKFVLVKIGVMSMNMDNFLEYKEKDVNNVVDNFEFLGSRNDGGSANQNYSAPASNNSTAYSPEAPVAPSAVETTDISEDPYKDFGDEFTLSSDDLPF